MLNISENKSQHQNIYKTKTLKVKVKSLSIKNVGFQLNHQLNKKISNFKRFSSFFFHIKCEFSALIYHFNYIINFTLYKDLVCLSL